MSNPIVTPYQCENAMWKRATRDHAGPYSLRYNADHARGSFPTVEAAAAATSNCRVVIEGGWIVATVEV